VSEAVIEVAAVTVHWDQLLHLAALLAASVGVDLPLLHCWVTGTVIVNVQAHCHIRNLSPLGWHWGTAQWTDWHLHILLVG